jgi:hypothetical protein
MATVPTYRGPQVRSAALTGGMQTGASNDGAFGGIQARQMAAAGKQVNQAAEQALDQLEKLDERRALEKAFEVENKVADEFRQFEEASLPNRQGEKAAGYRAEVEAWWDDKRKVLADGLDQRTQRALNRSLGRMRLQATGRAGSHELEQAEKVGQVNYETLVTREAREAASFGIAGNDAELNTSIKKITDSARAYYLRKGVPAAAVDEEVRSRVGKVHADVVVGLLQADPKRAKEYFERPGVAEGFTRAQRAEIAERLAKQVDGEEGAAGARETFKTMMAGRGYNDAVPYDQLDGEMVKRFEKKPEALKAARQELDRNVALWNRTQSERQAGGIQAAYELLNQGAPLRKIQASPAWEMMSPQQRDQFGEMLTNRFRASQAHAIQDRERAERAEELRTVEAALVYSDPAVLAKLSRAEVQSLRPALGDKNYEKVAKAWTAYQQDQVKLSNAKFDNDMFNEVLLSSGYDPKPKAGNKEQAALVIRARDAIETAIASEQKTKGRELTSQEKRGVAQTVIGARVMVDKPWYSGGDKEVPLFSADPKEVAEKGYILVGPKNDKKLRVSDVPPQDFADVKRFLRERGLPNDDVSVMRRWHEHTSNKKGR